MNFYEILGVSQTSTDKEIKKAYKQLVKKYHPDVYQGDKSIAEEKVKEINEAYDTLSNPDLREKYDLSIAPKEDLSSENYSSNDSYYTSTSQDIPKYEDLYRQDYYKDFRSSYTTNYYGSDKNNSNKGNTTYTTNYYGVSKENPNKGNQSVYSNTKNVDIWGTNRSRTILVLGITSLVVLILLLIMVSYIKAILNDPFFQNTSSHDQSSENSLYIAPSIYLGMTYKEVQSLLGDPDYVEAKLGATYAYWGKSYIIFDDSNIVTGWKNNGAFTTETHTGEESKALYNFYNYMMNEL